MKIIRDKHKVYLHGTLAKVAKADVLEIGCNTQPHLFAYLKNMSPQMDTTLRNIEKFNIIEVQADKQLLEGQLTGFNFTPNADIHVIPAVEGAVYVPAFIEAYGSWAVAAYYVAVAVVVSFVAQALSPKVATGNSPGSQKKSYMFSGPVNTTQQGGPIPIVYGKQVLVGSNIIAADEEFVRQ